ncbi:type III secretion system export apparatus subunit SctT [Uliginosibacterium gangwonense]|uniref:type III secretion system export apparatus subunit SctT n=1 Tax=Uliginosibacterium gangwonense TaxID=392736 RepID=UPI000361E270|nr:type III secretion system export apparatus subunit SctT [Uliginosibacterium gangwonense]
MQTDAISQINLLHTTWASLVQLLSILALCSLRVMVTFMVLPATSGEAIPGVARNGVILVLSMFVCFGQPMSAFESLTPVALFQLCGKEAFIGLLLGYAASTIFWVAESVGVVVDNLAGFNNVQMTNPLRGDHSTPVGNSLLQFVITLFYLLGGMSALLATIFETFRWWPLNDALPNISALAQSFVLKNTDSLFQMVIKISSPIMLVMVLIDLAFGILGRSAEKLEPSSLSQPVRGAIALMMLIVLTATIADQMREQLSFSDFSKTFQLLLSNASNLGGKTMS